jgi:hypothetical protein
VPRDPANHVRTPGGVRRLGAAAGLGAVAIALTLGSLPYGSAGAATTTTARPKTTTTAKPTATTAPNASTTTVAPTTTVTAAPTATSPHRVDPSTSTTTTTTPAGAPAPPEPAGVTLVSQPAWIPTAGVEVLQLHLDEPKLVSDPSAEVHITVHDSVRSRTDFNGAVTGENLGETIARLAFPLTTLSVNRHHNFLVGFGLSGSGAAKSMGIERAGVYPMEVGVIDDSPTNHGTFTTWLVVVDPSATASEPLRLAWMWQLETPPLVQPNGAIDPDDLAAMKPGGRLDRIATLLNRAGALPLTLGIGPETLSTWAAQAATQPALAPGVERVRRAAARASTQVLPEPYVPIAGPTIEAEDLGSHLPEEYVEGSNTIDAVTGQIPDPRTAFVDPIDVATVDRLTQMLVGRFVVRDTALVPVAEPLTPAQPFTLSTGSDATAPAAATDSGIERLIDIPGSPALRAQRFMAALAEIAYEAPSQPRGVVLGTPNAWSPDVTTMTLVLKDLADNPLVKPATLDTYFAEVPASETDAGPLQRQLAKAAVPDPLPLQDNEYSAAQRELLAYAAMVGVKDPSVEAGRQALLLALSTENSRPEALAYLQTIATRLDALTSGITTTAKALTLTARRASLPISFQNDTGRANVKVRVHLESAKLVFPEGPDFTVTLPVGHYTQEFPVEARASGTFAMTITLESPAGGIQLGSPTRVTIRSAVFSGIGIALTLGALLFLAAWWGNHFLRTRRNRRHARAAQ